MTEDMTTANDTIALTMRLDEDDFDALADEIRFRRGCPLPDGTSDRLGAIVGEICRDLEEYREKAPKWIVKADVQRALDRAVERACQDDVGRCVAICKALDDVRRELGLEA